jgi:hypothetical protein
LRCGFWKCFWWCGEAHVLNCKCELIAFTKLFLPTAMHAQA